MRETIFMIHGMFCGEWCWENYKFFFENKGYQCIAPTLRYHGIQPFTEPDAQLGTCSLRDYIRDLEKEIDGMDRMPILMGHSMGGLLAQILGSRKLVKALILLTPASPYGINTINPTVLKSFYTMMTKWGFWRKPFRQTFDEAVYSMLHLFPVEEQEALYNRLVFESGRAASEIGFWHLDLRKASKVDESKIICPVLVVSGAQDRITPVSVVRKVAEKYNEVSTYMEFSNHAHWVIGEPGWEEIAEYIFGFFKNEGLIPREEYSSDRRQFPRERIPLRSKTTIRLGKQIDRIPSIIQDISLGGVRVSFPRKTNIKKETIALMPQFELSFGLPKVNDNFRLECNICRMDYTGKGICVGASFRNPEERVLQKIKRYIA
jgi:pimeloyl-ACP methyl ester carboxylesterase